MNYYFYQIYNTFCDETTKSNKEIPILDAFTMTKMALCAMQSFFLNNSLFTAAVGIRYLREKHVYPTFKEINRRLQNVESDQVIRHGEATRVRRSDFLDW